MKKLLLLLLSSLPVGFLLAGLSSTADGTGIPLQRMGMSWAPARREEAVVTGQKEGMTKRTQELKIYVEGVMQSWAPARIPSVDLSALATDIATVSDTPRDAVLLASLAYFEGARFASYVDDGSCNDFAWRASASGRRLMEVGGACDGGRAFTLWQIHPDGISIDGEKVMGARLLADRRYAASVALTLAHADPSLCAYAGESGFCPKAATRLAFAERALRVHPF